MLDPWVFPLVFASENYFQASNYTSTISKAIKKKKATGCSFYMKWLNCVERIAEF